MTRPHLAGAVEDGWNRALGGALRSRGWRHLVVPHTGYARTGADGSCGCSRGWSWALRQTRVTRPSGTSDVPTAGAGATS